MEGDANVSDNAPISYLENTREEKALLILANNFLRQFVYLFPNRVKPPLILRNEHGVEKMVSTTLCPLKVSMPVEMRKWDFCAKFFAEYFNYETLEPPVAAPTRLASIESILASRKGNSLDLSIVLCSFLLAANYDAYVVQGYARKNVCEKERSKDSRPPVKFDSYSEYHRQFFTPSEGEAVASKYQLDFEKVKSFWIEGRTEAHFEACPQEVIEQEPEEDLLGQRVHYWILVRRFENGDMSSFMVEPTTGELVLASDQNYLGIEFVWNDCNFWSNKQTFNMTCEGEDVDFDDCTKWESFLSEDDIAEGGEPLRMPGTWVRDVQVRDEDLHKRYPEKGRFISYKKATVEKYNLNCLKNGLVYKVTYFETEKKDDPLESHAFFCNRRDLLEYRKTNFEKGCVEDAFAEGRPDALKIHIYPIESILSFPQELEFFALFRDDGLSSRVWKDTVTVDKFSGRGDLLLEREVQYYLPRIEDGEIAQPEVGQTLVKQSETENAAEEESLDKEKSNTEEISEETNPESADTTPQDSVDGSQSKTQVEGTETVEERHSSQESGQETSSSSKDDLKDAETSEKVENLFLGLGSFDSVDDALKGVDLSKWTYQDFLENIDPAERYATSESESEQEPEKGDEKGTEDASSVAEETGDEEISPKQMSNKEVDKIAGEHSSVSSGKSDKRRSNVDVNNSATKEERIQKLDINLRDDTTESTGIPVKERTNVLQATTTRTEEMRDKKQAVPDAETNVDDIAEGKETTVDWTEATDQSDQVKGTAEDLAEITDLADQMSEIVDHLTDTTDQTSQVKETVDALTEATDQASQIKETVGALIEATYPTSQEKEIVDALPDATDPTSQVKETVDALPEATDHTDQVKEPAKQQSKEEPSIRSEDEDMDEEMELYDDINFDELSDEELEVDYQLFLSKLWNKYSQSHKKQLFYMSREYLYHKDLRKPDILRLKKKIMRKRRRNVRYLQRVESGKPDLRVYRKKVDEVADRSDNIFTKDLVSFLELEDILGDCDVSAISELCVTDNLEAADEEALVGEIIKKESLKLLDTKTKGENANKRKAGHVSMIKQKYAADKSVPSRFAVEYEWFEFETDSYRVDFQYEEDRSSRRVLYFTKPGSGMSEFGYADHLCREVLPTFETEPTKRCQLYSYLAALVKKEPTVVRECEKSEREMQNVLLERRRQEEEEMKLLS